MHIHACLRNPSAMAGHSRTPDTPHSTTPGTSAMTQSKYLPRIEAPPIPHSHAFICFQFNHSIKSSTPHTPLYLGRVIVIYPPP